jgi:hypothetical protein
MVNSDRRTKKHLESKGRYVVALVGAVFVASWLTPLHAQTMGGPTGKMPEVDSKITDSLVGDRTLVFVPIIRTETSPQQFTGEGNSADSGHYTPDGDALKFTGGCKDEACGEYTGKAYVDVTAKVSTQALGVSSSDPITEVIPAIIIKIGNESCWWSCSSAAGSSSCDCVCAPAKNPPACPRQ